MRQAFAKRLIWLFLLLGAATLLIATGHSASTDAALTEVRAIDARYSGNLGVYIKDLTSGETLRYEADRSWYLASTTKIPIAIAFLRAVRAKRFTLGDLTALRESDKVDGMGGLQFQKPGTIYSFDYLLEQMIVGSDSTAADILVRLLGQPELNRDVAAFGAGAFSSITSLLDVRRHAYSEIHPNARFLPNRAFFELKRAGSNAAQLAILSTYLAKAPKRFATQSVKEAFERYYEKGLNSGTLAGFGELLARLARGSVLPEGDGRYLIRLMTRTNTGKQRIL